MALFKPSAKLSFGGLLHYNPLHLQREHSEHELRKEYTRLRSIAVKRLARLEKAGYERTSVYKYFKKPVLKKLSDIKTMSNLAKSLAQLAQFIESPLSTVTGQKEQRKSKIEKLQSYGYEIDESNFDNFTEWMELLAGQAEDLLYDSEGLVELWETIREKVSPEEVSKDMEWWLDNRYYIMSIPDVKSKSAAEIRKLIEGN